MNKGIMFLVFFILVISGCTGDGNSNGGLSVSGNKDTEILAIDILSINDFEIIPSEQLTPGKSFILRLEAENIGNNPVTLKVDDFGSYDGDKILYDYCSDIFSLDDSTTSFRLNPSPVGIHNDIEIKSNALQFFEWRMKTSDDLNTMNDAGITCNFMSQLSYDAVASTNTYVYFATPFEILRSFYTKQNMYLLGSNIATNGPLKINIVTDYEQPIAIDNNAWTISINIENVGDGLAEIISLNLVQPKEISYDINFECDLNKAENLDIYKGGSDFITCMFTPPHEDVLIATAYKIKAVAKYTYTVTDSIQVTVKP
ncbi:MAG: hypothetical protein K0B07_00265 [DPANN group archaeon]|nr:hypothetical protein [DPANN group archaeon]